MFTYQVTEEVIRNSPQTPGPCIVHSPWPVTQWDPLQLVETALGGGIDSIAKPATW